MAERRTDNAVTKVRFLLFLQGYSLVVKHVAFNHAIRVRFPVPLQILPCRLMAGQETLDL